MKKILTKLFCFSLIFACIFYAAFSATNVSVALAESVEDFSQQQEVSPEVIQDETLANDAPNSNQNALPNGEAQQEPIDSSPRFVMVLGGGKVTAQPDVAFVEIGVESLNSDLQTALDENNQIISSLIDYLTEQGVSQDDIRTKYYSIYQKHDYSASERFLGYQVSSTLEFKCTDINNLGNHIKQLTSLGANRLGGISFDCLNTSSYYQQALKLAIEDAKSKAEALCDKPLSLVKIIEESVYTSLPYRMLETSLSNASTILKGSMTVEAKIKVVFE